MQANSVTYSFSSRAKIVYSSRSNCSISNSAMEYDLDLNKQIFKTVGTSTSCPQVATNCVRLTYYTYVKFEKVNLSYIQKLFGHLQY